MSGPDLKLAEDVAAVPSYWEKPLRVRGGGTFVLRVWYGPLPHEYDWELRSVDGVLLAKCPCTKPGHRHPEIAASTHMRQGPPKGCLRCISARREEWCELWRERTKADRRHMNLLAGRCADDDGADRETREARR